MIARSGIYHVDPRHFDDALAFYRTDLAQQYLRSAGNAGGVLLGNRTTGKLLGISLWHSDEEMEASEAASHQLRVGVQRAGKGHGEILREDWHLITINVSGVSEQFLGRNP